VPDVAAFTKLPCAATDLKSTFNYHVAFNTTGEIDLATSVTAARNTDSEWLLRLQGREKLDHAYGAKARIFAPLGQSREDFIENQHTRHNRHAGEMPEQARMIRVDYAANFKVHLTTFRSSRHIQQLGEVAPNDCHTTCIEHILSGIVGTIVRFATVREIGIPILDATSK